MHTRVLYLDLTHHTFEIKVHSHFDPQLGGEGLAFALFQQDLERDPVVFAIGTLSALFPYASRTTCVFVSPQTGFPVATRAGGWLAAALRMCEVHAIVMVGNSPRPVVPVISESSVSFVSAQDLWGMKTTDSWRILAHQHGVPSRRSIVTIGPAGERGASFGTVAVDRFFSFPSFGLGGVFGERRLKGFVVSGGGSVSFPEKSEYRRVFSDIVSLTHRADPDRLYPDFREFGLLAQFPFMMKAGGVPTRNLTGTRFEGTDFRPARVHPRVKKMPAVSSFGVYIPELYLASVGASLIPVDYSSLSGLAGMLGFDSFDAYLTLACEMYELGADPVGAGVGLAFLTEHAGLKFGDAAVYIDLMHGIIDGKPQLKPFLGSFSKVANRMDGDVPLLHVHGVPLPPYFSGYASMVTLLCTLTPDVENTEAPLLDMALKESGVVDESLVSALIQKELTSLQFNTLGIDYVARGVYANSALIFAALTAVGHSPLSRSLENWGKALYHLKAQVLSEYPAYRERSSVLPDRVYRVPSPQGKLRKETVEMLRVCYQNEHLSLGL